MAAAAKRCSECKHGTAATEPYRSRYCTHPVVNAKNAEYLAGLTGANETEYARCTSERSEPHKRFFGLIPSKACGREGALWEAK